SLTFIWMSRSTLHYAGLYGARTTLRHVRQQARPGERFVHQTLCYETVDEALCCSVVFEMIGSTKWIPPANSLVEMMAACGWKTLSSAPAPDLLISSEEIIERYNVSADRILYIREHLLRDFGEMPRVYEPTPKGFRIFGLYKSFTCEAV
ncbi:MAG TPA: hypothetical protein P5137_17345, partial [Candidatus Brocadiia bacterium]|nr:hypothetical protein [Candidatus Brocadiia bacterium]